MLVHDVCHPLSLQGKYGWVFTKTHLKEPFFSLLSTLILRPSPQDHADVGLFCPHFNLATAAGNAACSFSPNVSEVLCYKNALHTNKQIN